MRRRCRHPPPDALNVLPSRHWHINVAVGLIVLLSDGIFANVLRELDFESCLVDTDVWRRPATEIDGFSNCEYILCYVDDCLVISYNPKCIFKTLKEKPYSYTLKDEGPPERYLGAKVGEYHLGDERTWFMSAKLYLKNALQEIKNKWGNLNKLFPLQMLDTPMSTDYHPEIDDSRPLDDEDIQLYQSCIGMLRWSVELGRIDLAKVSGTMARFSALPRENHMITLLNIFSYCKKHLSPRIFFDHYKKDFDHIEWVSREWKDFYPDIVGETLLPCIPEPRENSV